MREGVAIPNDEPSTPMPETPTLVGFNDGVKTRKAEEAEEKEEEKKEITHAYRRVQSLVSALHG